MLLPTAPLMRRSAVIATLFALVLGTTAGAQDCEFVRGNIINRSSDGGVVVDLNDGVEILAFLFLGNAGSLPASGCVDAADVNDNGLVDLHDYIALVDFRFSDGPPPPAPFPDAGTDPTAEVTVPDERDARFTYALGSGLGGAGDTGIQIPLTLSSEVEIRGLQVAISYDPADLRVDQIRTEEGTLLSGESTEYIVASFDNTEGVAFIGALKDFATPFYFQTGADPYLPAGEDQLVATFVFGVVVGNQDLGVSPIEFTDGIVAPNPVAEEGRPGIHNLIVLDDGVVRPTLGEGAGIEIVKTFIRGDTNRDTTVDLSDPVFHLNWIFKGSAAPGCLDAADANNDSRLDLSDSIWTLNFLFTGGPQPSEPYPQPGVDPSDDGSESLGCESDP